MPRKKKPTTLHILNGNPSKIKDLGEREPKPEPKAPDCPDFLSEDAKTEWARVAPILEGLGLLTRIDMAALAAYCESWAMYKKAIQFIHKHGEVYPIKDDKGQVKYLQQVPQVGIANKSLGNIKNFCTEFGMTPSSRSRMQVPGADDEDDETEAILNRRKTK